MIDQLPSIIAFAEARIKQLMASPTCQEKEARVDELNMILALCRGFQQQNEIFEKVALKRFQQNV